MASISTFTDPFTTGTVPNPALWVNDGWSLNGGNLYFHSSGDWVQPSNVSKNSYTLTGGSVSFRVTSVDTNSSDEALVLMFLTNSMDSFFGTDTDATYFGWVVRHDSSGVRADVMISGRPDSGNVPHTVGNRYRVREWYGYIVFEYSKNGTAWTFVQAETVAACLPAGGPVFVAVVGDTPDGGNTTLRVDSVNA